MFNKYIDCDDMTEDTLLLATIRMNTDFALVSVRCILNSPNYDEEVYGTCNFIDMDYDILYNYYQKGG